MWQNIPKPAPTFFDFVTDTKYQLFNEQSITVKDFYTKFNEYKVWLEKATLPVKMSSLRKELINFDIALSLAQEHLEAKQHPYFNYFTNDIKMILKYKREIENLIKAIEEAKILERNSKFINNVKSIEFKIDQKSKKLHITTLKKNDLGWNKYLQLIVYLFYNNRLSIYNDPLIIETILMNSTMNMKVLTKQTKRNINEESENYMGQGRIFNKAYSENKLIINGLYEEVIELIKDEISIKKIEENIQDLIDILKR